MEDVKISVQTLKALTSACAIMNTEVDTNYRPIDTVIVLVGGHVQDIAYYHCVMLIDHCVDLHDGCCMFASLC